MEDQKREYARLLDESVKKIIKVLSGRLEGFYIPTRYPSSVPDSIPARIYTKQAASQALALAEYVVKFEKIKISNDRNT